MKKLFIATGSIIFILVLGLGLMLFYPQPATTSSPSETIYNKDYFITKFTQHNVQLLNENTFTILEEELEGYVNEELKDGNISFDQGSFKATHIDIQLLEDRMLLGVYGKFYTFPVRVQADLEPHYQEGKIYFTLTGAKLSRINIPEKHLTKLIGDSINLESNLENNSHFILPIEIHEMIIINNIDFKDGELNLQYKLNKEKLLEELLKGFKSRIGL